MPLAGWPPNRPIDVTGMNGINEPAPVIGVSRYSHLTSTWFFSSVSASRPLSPPKPASWKFCVVCPLWKSNSRARTPFDLPTSPVIVKTPRSREYHPLSLLVVTSRACVVAPVPPASPVEFLYIVVTKSSRPLIVTFGAGAGACANAGGPRNPPGGATGAGAAGGLPLTPPPMGGGGGAPNHRSPGPPPTPA